MNSVQPDPPHTRLNYQNSLIYSPAMSLTRTLDRERIACLFHALSDETRLRIIECLQEGEQCVCDLTDRLKTAQSRLSFHLKTLKDAGLLADRRAGRWVYYSVNREAIEDLKEFAEILEKRCSRRARGSPRCP